MKSQRRTITKVAALVLFLSGLMANSAYAAECAPSTTFSNGYMYYAFKDTSASCTWTVPADATNIDYLVVAGGGSGGSRHAGGGGAGGMLTGTSTSLAGVTSLGVSVGPGGAAVTPSGNNWADGLNGTNSILSKNSGAGAFVTVTALGGGGGSSAGDNATAGGSGGGSLSGTVGAGTSGQGNAGGLGVSGPSYWSSGGGGGAGHAGYAAASQSVAGAGGEGAIWLADFDTKTATALGLNLTNQTSGASVYFAGGGGAGSTATAASGGIGGGGAGSIGANTATSGTANSGGGGGGAGCCNPNYSGAGGSGVIIIRYPANVGLSLAISATPIYRAVTNIVATANIDGKVTFLANGKAIPGCKNLATVSKTVTCPWKPSLHGISAIAATITSSTYASYKGSFSRSATILARSNNR